jgi:ankyrin repeat protein
MMQLFDKKPVHIVIQDFQKDKRGEETDVSAEQKAENSRLSLLRTSVQPNDSFEATKQAVKKENKYSRLSIKRDVSKLSQTPNATDSIIRTGSDSVIYQNPRHSIKTTDDFYNSKLLAEKMMAKGFGSFLVVEKKSEEADDLNDVLPEEIHQELESLSSGQLFVQLCGMMEQEMDKEVIVILENLKIKDLNDLRDEKTNCTLLHRAAKYARLKVMKYLLAHNVNIESKDYIAATPLFYAAAGGSLAACGLLLSRGAQVNIRDHVENSPLLIALRQENWIDLVACFLLFRADVNFKTSKGNTPVMVVAQEGHYLKVLTFLFIVTNGLG